MSQNVPLFSVVIPTLGRPSLREAVLSVLAQTFQDFEVLVVADGEGVPAKDVLCDVDDSRVHTLNGGPQGVSAKRNVGAAAARGTWLTFLDDDDVARPQWLEAWVGAIEPGVQVVTGELQYVVEGAPAHVAVCHLDPTDRTMGAATLLASGFTVRRQLFANIDGYDEQLRYSENRDLGLRLSDELAKSQGNAGVVRHSPGAKVEIHVGAVRERMEGYGTAQGEAAEILLETHRERALADHKGAAALLRVIARSSRLIDDRRGARLAALRACKLEPSNHKNWRALVVAVVPGTESLARLVSGLARRQHRQGRVKP